MCNGPAVMVECYSGHTYAERPQAFEFGGKRHAVAELLAEWREPHRRRYRVKTQEAKVFELCYNETLDSWSAMESHG